jgi:hypothetical protein
MIWPENSIVKGSKKYCHRTFYTKSNESSQLLHDVVEIIPITVRLLPVGLGRWKR